jgi:hypothetical protein
VVDAGSVHSPREPTTVKAASSQAVATPLVQRRSLSLTDSRRQMAEEQVRPVAAIVSLLLGSQDHLSEPPTQSAC